MKPLTERQQEILTVISDHIEMQGYPPTVAEITDTIGVKSTNTVRGHLQALQKKGAIELEEKRSRGIRLLTTSNKYEEELDHLPIVGTVAAGAPILAQENIESHVRINRDMFSDKADYLLRVQGMSMRDVGILDGDLLAVQRRIDVFNRQIVVARIDDEVTVKRFRQSGHTVYLDPENPEFNTITVDLEHQDLSIEGVVVGVIRSQVQSH
ncbi:MAG: transcriptional repressor LexA [Pseudomonadales bacterium]|nr:transcriptional repressor LexA [Pseudomonadales bacterium]